MIVFLMGLCALSAAFMQKPQDKAGKQLLVVGYGSCFAGLVMVIVPLIFKS